MAGEADQGLDPLIWISGLTTAANAFPLSGYVRRLCSARSARIFLCEDGVEHIGDEALFGAGGLGGVARRVESTGIMPAKKDD